MLMNGIQKIKILSLKELRMLGKENRVVMNRQQHEKKYKKKWYLDNKGDILKSREIYRRKNRDHIANTLKSWYANRKNDPDFIKKKKNQSKRSRNELKIQAYAKLGNACACCKESEIEFLTIDHINDDGADHRKKIKRKKQYSYNIKRNSRWERIS